MESQDLNTVKVAVLPRKSQQFNGKVERKFATLFGRHRATNNAAGYSVDLRNKLWCETADRVTDMECLLTSGKLESAEHKQFFNMLCPHVGSLMRTPGEIGVMRKGDTIKGKLTDRGIPVFYLNGDKGSLKDSYRLMNFRTKKVLHSRDVIWLNKTYKEYVNGPKLDK